MSAESSAPIKSWFELALPEQHKSLTEYLKSGYEYSGISTDSIDYAAAYGANAVFSSWVLCIGLILFALIAKGSLTKALNKQGVEKYYADSKVSIRNFLELYVSFIRDLSNSLLAKSDTKKFFWLFDNRFALILEF